MSGRMLSLACGLALAAGAVVAAPPEVSPRPVARHLPVAAAAPAAIAEGLALSLRPQPRPGVAIAATAAIAAGLAASVRPMPRPEPVARAMTPDPALPAVALVGRTHLILPALARQAPPARPGELGELITVAATVFPTKPLGSIITGRKGSVCGDRSIKGKTIPPIAAKLKGCGLEEGVELTSVAGVSFSAPVVTDCATATSLKDWVEGAVIPAVGRKGGGVERLQVAASYVCRPRNNQKGNKISEHGKGHAIDISAIVLADGSAISVERDWGNGKAGKILKTVRAAACGPFTTVLGPGSDRFHNDHLHLDTARGRGTWCR